MEIAQPEKIKRKESCKACSFVQTTERTSGQIKKKFDYLFLLQEV
jgi:hypothetical protein